MHRKYWINLLVVSAVGLAAAAASAPAQDEVADTTSFPFTYQGSLEKSGAPANGNCDFEFRLYDSLAGVTLLGSMTKLNVPVSGGVFTAELEATAMGLREDAEVTYLELSVCCPTGCSPVPLIGRQRVTHAPMAYTARSIRGVVKAGDDGAVSMKSSAAAGGQLNLAKDLGVGMTNQLSFDANNWTMAAKRDAGAAPMAFESRNATSGDYTQMLLDDAVGELSVSKVALAAEETTAALTTRTLRFKPADGSIAAVRSSGSAPLALRSTSLDGHRTQLLLDDAASQVSFSKELAAVNTADICPPPKLSFTLSPGATSMAAIPAPCDPAAATLTLISTSASGNKTQLFLDDALGKVTISKEAVALNTAAVTSKKLVIDAANGSVAAFNGISPAAVRFKTGDTLAMEIDPTTSAMTVFGSGGLKAKRLLLDAAVASNTAGGNPVVELVTSPGQLELQVDGETVDRWTGLADIGGLGFTPNRISGSPFNSIDAGAYGAVILGGGSDLNPNRVTDNFGTVCGGFLNQAGDGSSAFGGHNATVCGGNQNTASGTRSTVGGGNRNEAMGGQSTIPGGELNKAIGPYSFAAGQHAIANHDGAFVWADHDGGTGGDFFSTGKDQFLIRATGGMRLATNDGSTPRVQTVLPSTDTPVNLAINPLGGNVGIGTTTPDELIQAKNAGDQGGYVRIGGTVYTSLAEKRLRFGDGDLVSIGESGTEDDVMIINAANKMIINAAKVGIGRTPTANRLEVEGEASKTTASGWAANSDARIKTDVMSIDGALQMIERLRPIRFKYTEEYKAKHDSIKDIYYYNYVAQEFREVFPNQVKDSGEDGILQLDAYPASIYAVAAIQELHQIVHQTIEEKDCEIDQLREQESVKDQRINELEARLAALEAVMHRFAEQTNGGGR